MGTGSCATPLDPTTLTFPRKNVHLSLAWQVIVILNMIISLPGSAVVLNGFPSWSIWSAGRVSSPIVNDMLSVATDVPSGAGLLRENPTSPDPPPPVAPPP